MNRSAQILLAVLTTAGLHVLAQASDAPEACQTRAANLQKLNAAANGPLSPGCQQSLEQAQSFCLNAQNDGPAPSPGENKVGVRSYFQSVQKDYEAARDQSVRHALACKKAAQDVEQECKSSTDLAARSVTRQALLAEHECANGQSQSLDEAAKKAEASADAVSADSSQHSADGKADVPDSVKAAVFPTESKAVNANPVPKIEPVTSPAPNAPKFTPAAVSTTPTDLKAAAPLTGEILEGPLSMVKRFFSPSPLEPVSSVAGASENERAITALSGK